LEILVAVVEGDFLARHDRPQRHQHDAAFARNRFRIRPAAVIGVTAEIPSRRAVDGPGSVELEHVFGAEPALALVRFRGGNARAAVADDGCFARDRFGGEQAKAGRRAADANGACGHFF